VELPIVFVGPSLPLTEARRFLDADYRRPIRRGDLAKVPPNAVVAIIDGVFDQDLAVSPRELKSALGRGVRIFGSSSMGALRAAEVPGVVGVGRIYEMFAKGTLQDDDEVAITFDPESHRPLCEPMVNIRHAVERLVTPGTISREAGSAIVRAAKAMPYRERTYPLILRSAGLAQRPDAKLLQNMLAAHDLKREDAITLLEYLPRASSGAHRPASALRSPELNDEDDRQDQGEVVESFPGSAPLLFWEFGAAIPLSELVEFLALTGQLARPARNAAARYLLAGGELEPATDEGPSEEEVSARLFDRTSAQWGFFTDEETRVTLADLGIGAVSFSERVDEEIAAQRRVMALVREGSEEFLHALRMELFLDELALKRVAARWSSLSKLAARANSAEARVSEAEKRAALAHVCRALDVTDRAGALRELACWGLSGAVLERFVEMLALAGRCKTEWDAQKSANAGRPVAGMRLLTKRLKPAGELRFSSSSTLALSQLKRLCKLVGITRVSSITGLSDIGIPNAQAFRPDGQFSSTVGSGKSETARGARIGAVMEEVEKWAQEQYVQARHAGDVTASHNELLAARRLAVDPLRLDLPYDTCYAPTQHMTWRACHDLLGGKPVLVPLAALTPERLPHDIYFSARAGRKQFGTNGLASGFNLEDATCHALCEYVERHADVLSDILTGNPGLQSPAALPVIDPRTVPASTRRLLKKIERSGRTVALFDLRADIRVPTFRARVGTPIDADSGLFGVSRQTAFGKATHPSPEVALNMAVLEAVQSVMTVTAGAREDLTVRSRSLGRHERTASMTREAFATRNGDAQGPLISFDAIDGLVARDARRDVSWVVERIRDAGYPHVLVCELGPEQLAPARVVRVLVPGLETVNPFHTGLEARIRLVADLLPTSCLHAAKSPAVSARTTSRVRSARRAARAPAR
jgi:ribosomal protein S12 methylthiotransferase accessory factor